MRTRQRKRDAGVLVALAIAWAVLFAYAVVHGGSRMDARVSAKRDRVRLEVHVRPDEQDRAIHAALDDGENFFRMSSQLTWPTQTVYTFEWEDVPRGQYDIQAFVTGPAGDKPLCSTRLAVIVAGAH